MKTRYAGIAIAIILATVVAAASMAAQSGEKYTARLGWVPVAGGPDRANVTGKGTATAVLAGRKLTITGSFEGLAAPATVARLHRGVAKGARGNAIGELTITKATSGMISGSVDLTMEQVESLKQGKLYVQVHSEKGVAPDGSNLWGWFSK
ncbi:MAG TPA: CHRD domain-containing protein [Vicinamibacterales bacterium]